METIELSAAMAAVLKDNANPASLIGLNGADLTKSTMAQISSVVGGLNGNIGYKIKSTSLIELQGNSGHSSLLFIRSHSATGVYIAAGNWREFSSVTKISSPLNDSHLLFYRGTDGGVYVQSTDSEDGAEVTVAFMNGGQVPTVSNKDISTLTKLSV